ncbi:hypothetical protein Tco_0184557 [Tanacetum coccineum]
MEAHLAPKQPIQVNKISSSCEICSGPHDTQYCMENPEQAFVEYVVSDIQKRTKTMAKQQNRAWDWKEREKPKPKAYPFFMDQPRPT